MTHEEERTILINKLMALRNNGFQQDGVYVPLTDWLLDFIESRESALRAELAEANDDILYHSSINVDLRAELEAAKGDLEYYKLYNDCLNTVIEYGMLTDAFDYYKQNGYKDMPLAFSITIYNRNRRYPDAIEDRGPFKRLCELHALREKAGS